MNSALLSNSICIVKNRRNAIRVSCFHFFFFFFKKNSLCFSQHINVHLDNGVLNKYNYIGGKSTFLGDPFILVFSFVCI